MQTQYHLLRGLNYTYVHFRLPRSVYFPSTFVTLSFELHTQSLPTTHVKVGTELWLTQMELHHINIQSFLSHLCKRYAVIYISNKFRLLIELLIQAYFTVSITRYFNISFTVLFTIAKFILLSLRGWFPYIPTSSLSLYFLHLKYFK